MCLPNNKKNNLKLLLLCLVLANFLLSTHAFCSLEIMKQYAIEACDHLFRQYEIRDKRSPTQEFNLIDDIDYEKSGKHHYISRSIYPSGGYLKVNPAHFRILSQVHVMPKYRTRKVHHEHRNRFKRNDLVPSYNNIPYCCYHKCQEDFFC